MITPRPVVQGTSVVVYDYDNLTPSPIWSTSTDAEQITFKWSAVEKIALQGTGGKMEVLLPKTWDIIEVRHSNKYVAVIIKKNIR